MVQFNILDFLVFLPWGPPILLLTDAPVTTVSCVVVGVFALTNNKVYVTP
jgi:hypothetical protein